MKNFTLQENLLALLPMWNYHIAKPLKQFLDDGISLEMYYCIQTMRWYENPIKMSELSELTPLYNFLKEMPYEVLWCIISLRTKNTRKK